ncbi:MAG TPA: hypothetical protein ENN99_04485 [Chloroflexi bacterium]|nr:hypothetical protein [Chloroflexota bacterium]
MSDPRLEKLTRLRRRAVEGGGADRVAHQHAKGKQTVRERLDQLLDEATLNELEPFVAARADAMEDGADRPTASAPRAWGESPRSV